MSSSFIIFIYHEALSCIFPLGIFIILALSKLLPPHFILHRYDFILMGCLLLQVIMILAKLETKDEFKVILMFHLVGLILEIYKVHMHSWSYPESALTKVFGVPLYSGFMYASVASYICQAWRRLDLSLHGYPKAGFTIVFASCIYINFFSHHFLYDIRYELIMVMFILFFKTHVHFKLQNQTLKMPLSFSFLCIGFFIWIAENIATFFGAWRYPNQSHTWHLVHPAKIISWFLLVVVSFVIVAELKRKKNNQKKMDI